MLLRSFLLSLLLLPAIALSDAYDFNYIDIAYLNEIGDEGEDDLYGFGVDVSMEIDERSFVHGGYAHMELDENIPNVSLSGHGVLFGMGYVLSSNERGVFYGTAAIMDVSVTAKVDGVSFSESESGYSVGLGFRMNVGENAEVKGSYNHIDIDISKARVFEWDLVYHAWDNVSWVLKLGRDFENDSDTTGIGARINL